MKKRYLFALALVPWFLFDASCAPQPTLPVPTARTEAPIPNDLPVLDIELGAYLHLRPSISAGRQDRGYGLALVLAGREAQPEPAYIQ